MKKGQMEIMGLVIIVILITLGLLFMAQFALKEEPQKKIFLRKGLAYSTMSALMKTSIQCERPFGLVPYEQALTLGPDLLEDCVGFRLSGFSTYECLNQQGDKVDACAFLEETIKSLLNQTLGQWHKHYEFSSVLLIENGKKIIPSEDISEDTLKDKDGQGCLGERDTSGPFPLDTNAGLVESILYVCD